MITTNHIQYDHMSTKRTNLINPQQIHLASGASSHLLEKFPPKLHKVKEEKRCKALRRGPYGQKF